MVSGIGIFNTKTGKFYGQKTTFHGGNGRGANYITNSAVELTDPGQIAAVAVHLQVGSEIVQNYGGLSRGNSKETRNKYRGLAAAELSANGQTPLYQDYLNRAYAADQIYKALKRKARRGYMQALAVTAFTAGVASIPGIGTTVAGAAGGAITGDPKAALLAIAGAGVVGPQLSALGDVSQVAQITAHGVWGGVSSEILGGGFLEGFAGAAVGKAITVGSANYFGVGPGDFHLGHFGATVAGGALAAELAGGNGAIGAASAAFGYVINHGSATSRDERIRHQKAHEGGYLFDGGGSGEHILYAMEKGFGIATMLNPARATAYTIGSFFTSAYRTGLFDASANTAASYGFSREAAYMGFSNATQARVGAAFSLMSN